MFATSRNGIGRLSRYPVAAARPGAMPPPAGIRTSTSASRSRERRCDLDMHEVGRIVDARPAVLARQRQPVRADHRHHDLASRDLLLQHLDEIVAGLDVALHVHEQPLTRKGLRQEVVDAQGWPARVVAPVVEEDFAGHGTPARSRRRMLLCSCNARARARAGCVCDGGEVGRRPPHPSLLPRKLALASLPLGVPASASGCGGESG